MKEQYKQLIMEAVDGCADIDLLDLVWKLLLTDHPQPTDSNIIYLDDATERSKSA